MDRLTSATGAWGTIDYTYNGVGNRLTKSHGGTVSYAYDCMNRLTDATGMGFGGDGNGNMVYTDDGGAEWNYTYDPEDRLVRVLRGSRLTLKEMNPTVRIKSRSAPDTASPAARSSRYTGKREGNTGLYYHGV